MIWQKLEFSSYPIAYNSNNLDVIGCKRWIGVTNITILLPRIASLSASNNESNSDINEKKPVRQS